MTQDKDGSGFTHRALVSMVREELAAAGRRGVAIERRWIDDDTPGQPFLLMVPVGTGLVVPLRPRAGFDDVEREEHKRRHAREFAQALLN